MTRTVNIGIQEKTCGTRGFLREKVRMETAARNRGKAAVGFARGLWLETASPA